MTQRKIWGIRRTYEVSEDTLVPAGGKVIYGYPYPSDPHIIQGYAVEYSRYSPEPYDEDIEATKGQKGILMTLDCEGYGNSVDDALAMADCWKEREESRLMIEEMLGEIQPDYTQQIAPTEYQKVKRIDEDENYDTRQSLESAEASERLNQKIDKFFYRLIEKINHEEINPVSVKEAYTQILEEQKRTTTRERLFDHLYTPEIQNAIFGKLIQTTKQAWEAYSPFEKGPIGENRNKKNLAYHAYKRAQETLFRAEKKFKESVISTSVKSNRSIRDCIVLLGAEKMFFNSRDKTGDSNTMQKLQKYRETLQKGIKSSRVHLNISNKTKPKRKVTVNRGISNKTKNMDR